MAIRYVKSTGKDRDGDITKLCNTGETWSPRSKADAISDIDGKVHEYKVKWTDTEITDIHTVSGKNGKHLRTDRDNTSKNNLDDLPDC